MKQTGRKLLAAFICACMFAGQAVCTPVFAFDENASAAISAEAELPCGNEPELQETPVYQVSEEYEQLHFSGAGSISDEGAECTDASLTEGIDMLLDVCGRVRSALAEENTGTFRVLLDDIKSITTSDPEFGNIIYYCPYFDGTNIKGALYCYSDGSFAYLQITNNFTAAETAEWLDLIDSKIAELNALIAGNDLTEADKALILHDYMVSHYHYDEEGKSFYPSIILTEKKGVCQSYAYLFQYIMNLNGYECHYTRNSAGNHAWNILRIGDNYYHIDVTWDDPRYDRFGGANHVYFLLSDDTIKTYDSHTDWNLTEYACSDTSYEDDYFASATSPVIIDGDDCYYIDGSGLKKHSADGETLVDDPGNWYVFGNDRSYYVGVRYSGLFEYDGKLYYNSYKAVLTYDLKTGETETYEDVDTTDGYVYGITAEDGKILYECAESPNVDYSSKDIRTLDLPAMHEHVYDEGRITLAPTESSEGVMTYTCTICGAEKTEVIPKVIPESIVTITIQPQSISAAAGSKISFSVKAESTAEGDISYQWYYSKNGLKWSKTSVAGARTSTVSMPLTASKNGYRYKCIATDSCGSTAVSDEAVITVTENPLAVTQQPSDMETAKGDMAQFSVGVSYQGEYTLQYQWYYSADKGSTWRKTTLTGSRTAVLCVRAGDARNGRMYRCLISDGHGNSVTSAAAVLYVD